jgi:hypothetical protein
MFKPIMLLHSLYDTLALDMACPLWLVLNEYKMKNVMSNIQWLLVLCYLSITTKGLYIYNVWYDYKIIIYVAIDLRIFFSV